MRPIGFRYVGNTVVGFSEFSDADGLGWGGGAEIASSSEVAIEGEHKHATGDLISGILGVPRGGTGHGEYAVGDLVYASGSAALARLAAGAENEVLTMGADSVPAWVSSLVLAGTLTVAGAVTLQDALTVAGLVKGPKVEMTNDGSAGAPTYRFSTDPDTGVFLAGDGILGFATAGVEGFRLQSGILLLGTTVTTGASAGDLVLANGKWYRSVDNAGTGTRKLIRANGSLMEMDLGSAALLLSNPNTSTGATAGTNGDVPSQVDGYLAVQLDGVAKRIPFYNA